MYSPGGKGSLAKPSLVRAISLHKFSSDDNHLSTYMQALSVNLTFCQLSFLANSLLKIGSSMEKIKREEKEILMKEKEEKWNPQFHSFETNG